MSPFSQYNANLQIAWDSTSLRALMTCARYYQYTILEGWRGSNVHLEFGGYFASAVERYRKARLEGKTKDDARLASFKWLIMATWREALETDPEGFDRHELDAGRQVRPGPWGGSYDEQWRCTGTEPYRNAKGNRAKCPWSHKGAWYPAPGPSLCGECGSHTETSRHWIPTDETKNRVTLIRTFLWYLDEQPATENDGGLQPFAFPTGTPAVELSFTLPSPWRNECGEPIILAGHLDAIVTIGGDYFIADNKTTSKALSKNYWQTFSPHVQVDFYDLIGSILYPGLNIRGVVIEGAQISASGSKFGVGIFRKSEAQREEYLGELEWWIKQAEIYAKANYWPMNRSACYLCPFKPVCGADPSERERLLKASFVKQKWNPLEVRV